MLADFEFPLEKVLRLTKQQVTSLEGQLHGELMSFHRSGINSLCVCSALVLCEQMACIAATRLVLTSVIPNSNAGRLVVKW